ncbi:hypothetical protein AGABI1DRAFT_134691 [Agaricus bisporus var. burnettii JB137-S8]|uniref:Uncharacterized protein n=1 Tax=Agaricus bisporus var. burnettii (strain JB137-S8 / ATCC MYA-4627 / FGSC 10392) TaxID=597362 RepID=K5VGL5_AGABU|nr:uncharacterized protein AGABI1DRAFT_134691 [Agaricus bisporus var. burnettii JB137-S8]EKM73484.1 hypothetical protein AGABI1DRAFT_134691 [Agaricus bisporus var. burnettii JB137-S8]
MIPAEPKVWQSTQRSAFTNALSISPVGKELSIAIKHAVRFMRTSAHSDTCVAWIDIHDSVAGTSARSYINKTIVIGGRNCQIRGVAPRPGSALCTRCMRWGHHSQYAGLKASAAPSAGFPTPRTPTPLTAPIPSATQTLGLASTVVRQAKRSATTLLRTLRVRSGRIDLIGTG